MRPENSDASLPPPILGKHRIQAEFKRLEQEVGFLEKELEQLEKMEKASAACR